MSAVDLEKLYALAGSEAAGLAEEWCGCTVFLDDNYQIDDFLADNNAPLANREEILRDLTGAASDLFRQLAHLLLKEGLWRRFRLIKDEYISLVETKQGIRYAELRTAFPLTAVELKQIKEKIGPNVKYNMVEDQGLIGGFIVTFNDGRTLDASVRGKLEQLKMEIAR